MYKALLIPLFFVGLSLFCACNDGFDDYSASPNDLLSFSTDTVAFDTIISTINTPYRLFKVYNRHSKALLISSVYLENGASSGFKINVDGHSGVAFQDIEIRGNDSIFVFVDAKPAQNHSDQPEYLQDYIVFVTNGVQQKVFLEASAQDAVIWKGHTFPAGYTILEGNKPYLIYDSLVVNEGTVLEIKEGVRFYMHNPAEIIVRGTVKARGTLEKPVVIRGDRFDNYLSEINYDQVPGQWGGVRFESNSYENEWEHVYIRNGKYGVDFSVSELSRPKMKMKNVVMTNFKGTLLRAVNCHIEFDNCEFTNARNALLSLTGGAYRFTHCTIANYYLSSTEMGWGNSDHETLRLMGGYFDNNTPDTVHYPVQADFYNTIIWGRGRGSGIQFEDPADEIRAVFRNCVITSEKTTHPDIQWMDCLAKDPQFKQIASDYLKYDFRLDSLSPARNIANPVFSQPIPFDIKGIDRFADEGPDIGGYEFYPEKKL